MAHKQQNLISLCSGGWELETRVPTWWGSGEGLRLDLAVFSMVKTRTALWGLFYIGSNPSCRTVTSRTNHLPKTSSSNTFVVTFHYMNFREKHIQVTAISYHY
jgi:hypothetical protein